MITVLHRGGLANDYSIPWILGCYIRNIISKDLTKKHIFSVGKKSFLGGMSKWLQLYIGGGYGEMITVLHRGGYAQMITILHRGEGSLGTPRSDYVICARPLMIIMVIMMIRWIVKWCFEQRNTSSSAAHNCNEVQVDILFDWGSNI